MVSDDERGGNESVRVAQKGDLLGCVSPWWGPYWTKGRETGPAMRLKTEIWGWEFCALGEELVIKIWLRKEQVCLTKTSSELKESDL